MVRLSAWRERYRAAAPWILGERVGTLSEHHDGSERGSESDDGDADEQRDIHDATIVSGGRRRRAWPWVVGPLLVAALVAAFLVPMPYYVDGPGVVRATQPRVSISGHRSYTSKGEIFFTTVSERRATPFLLLQSWLDDSIDTVSEKVAVPGGNREKEQREEQAQMDRSKLTALQVAFGVVHLPITITGTGAFINQVGRDYPAASVLNAGDVITAVNGAPVTVVGDLRPLLADQPVGATVILTLRRKGASSTSEVPVTLGRNPDDDSHGYLGIVPSTADEHVDLGFHVELDSGSVIGPSAGLAWTLGVIDRLTPGDLTHGKKVAVTGTIASDGSVGPIGGIGQKVVGAKEAGAKLFLYPAATSKADVKRLKALAGDDIAVKPVATVQDALKVLDPAGLGAA